MMNQNPNPNPNRNRILSFTAALALWLLFSAAGQRSALAQPAVLVNVATNLTDPFGFDDIVVFLELDPDPDATLALQPGLDPQEDAAFREIDRRPRLVLPADPERREEVFDVEPGARLLRAETGMASQFGSPEPFGRGGLAHCGKRLRFIYITHIPTLMP